MKTKQFLSLLAIGGLLFMASCKKDGVTTLSKDEATTALNSVNTSYTSIRGEYESSTAAAAQQAVGNLNLGFSVPNKAPSTPDAFRKDVLNSIKPSFAKTSDGFGPNTIDFDFTGHVGTWTYNTTTSQWVNSGTPTDKVIIIFSFNGGTNNATLTYYDYLEGTFDGSPYCTQLKAKVEIAGAATNPVMSWVYTDSETMTTAAITSNVKFVYNLGIFSQTQSASMSLTGTLTSITATASMLFEVTKNNEVVFSTSADVAASGNQNSYTMNTKAEFRVMDVIIKWNINATNTTNFTGDPTNFMTVAVWTASGAKVADIVFVYDSTNSEYVPYLKYADGTQEKVSDRFGDGQTEGTLGYEFLNFLNSIKDINIGV